MRKKKKTNKIGMEAIQKKGTNGNKNNENI